MNPDATAWRCGMPPRPRGVFAAARWATHFSAIALTMAATGGATPASAAAFDVYYRPGPQARWTFYGGRETRAAADAAAAELASSTGDETRIVAHGEAHPNAVVAGPVDRTIAIRGNTYVARPGLGYRPGYYRWGGGPGWGGGWTGFGRGYGAGWGGGWGGGYGGGYGGSHHGFSSSHHHHHHSSAHHSHSGTHAGSHPTSRGTGRGGGRAAGHHASSHHSHSHSHHHSHGGHSHGGHHR
jgi:hypothetical protein